YTEAVRRIRELVQRQALGDVFAADLVFHNGYGPDKAWFYDPALSGGGCVMDLGVHLVDLALWMLDFPDVVDVSSHLYARGRPLQAGEVEDYAVVTLGLASGATVRVACSWRLELGCDAVISAKFYGTSGGAALRNVGGSFYDFEAAHFTGTSREILAKPPDPWGGRAAAEWAMKLAAGGGFAVSTSGLLETARVLDRVYGRGAAISGSGTQLQATR
ncbi:MAG: Gfo/Idh/MocA family oxidoreductase, partial [Pseudomonadota bacterium]|nr:Gfo/Idh/MocA family oxidoreductase [Pseudomonadota bacterium]